MDTVGDRRGDNAKALFDELKSLRKGFGLNGSRPIGEFGPLVRRASGVTAADTEWTTRAKIRATFDRLSDCLAELHRTVARAALGFDAPPTVRYTERLMAVATRAPDLDRSERTLKRRCDDALRLLAELALAEQRAEVAARNQGPWHTSILRTRVLLDEPEIEAIETRRIASHVAGLSVIRLSLTVAPPEKGDRGAVGRLRLRMLSGAEVIASRRAAAARVEFDLRLSRVLDAEEEHDIEFMVGVPEMSPYYLCTPAYPCELFDLRIRFGRRRGPSRVQVVDGAFAHEAGDPTVPRATVGLDRAGEVRHVFRDLAPYRSYGLLWA
ncbi:hypothetical protein SAMN05192558_10790 [Actinokineospora alba]|uniref:Uncharacterized protein n=1 Tax=Actinokineospora alba TaxID=504798 RepID=A0A1H0QRI4_9PSEU|nr:hypothetical protein [Actinokineospora alba]TDP70451.1 hypothetical protein C8E96_6061 [Actinokineospora alba]SDI31332.1 hypothetical protein SAMN05421871_10489 [Actinokineospora alba]SDP19298.1 hypothetical protein SAMN05192558_10790 [Actinokineospora alba]